MFIPPETNLYILLVAQNFNIAFFQSYIITYIYKLELAKFMFALHNNRLPKIFYDSLTKLESVRDHSTRQLTKNVYFEPPINKNIGRKIIVYGEK